MQNQTASTDQLNINIGITASPEFNFEKSASISSHPAERVSDGGNDGFAVYLNATLQYESLSRVISGYMAGKRFDLTEGLLAKHIVVKKVTVAGTIQNELLLKVDFSGSFTGTLYLNGTPVYHEDSKTLEVQNLGYDLQTRNFLLQTAKWLFSGKIEAELKKASRIELGSYFTNAQEKLNTYLNKEWTSGIKGAGAVKELRLISTQAQPQHLVIRIACTGDLSLSVSAVNLSFHH